MIPIKLILKNFTSYPDAEIDFTKFLIALVIGSYEGDIRIANGVGKTNLFTAITFALYGKVRFSAKVNAVRRGCEIGRVEFIFSSGNETYKIERELNVRSKTTAVVFSKKIEDKWIKKGLTCDTPTQTNKKIEEVLGMNYDAFINITYFRQNDVSGFTSATPTERKEILKDALRIGEWDKYYKKSKDEEKDLSKKQKALKERLQQLETVEKEIKENKSKAKEARDNLKSIQLELQKVKKSYNDKNNEISELNLLIAKDKILNKGEFEKSKKNIINELKEMKKTGEDLKNKIKNNNQKAITYDQDKIKLEERLSLYYKDWLRASFDKPRNQDMELKIKKYASLIPRGGVSESLLNEKIEEKITIQREVDICKFDLKRLLSLKPEKECPTCLTTLDDIESVNDRRDKKKVELEEQLVKKEKILNKLMLSIKKEADVLEKAKRAEVEIERTELIISKQISNISETYSENERIQGQLRELHSKWKRLKKEKENINMIIESADGSTVVNKLEDLIIKRRKIHEDIDKLEQDARQIETELARRKGEREELERRMSEKRTLIKEKEKVSFDLTIYSKLSRAFGKDGIQAIIMENVTEDLKEYTNTILQTIYHKPMSVSFITQKQINTGAWKEDFTIEVALDGELFDFEDISGGEQVRVSIAIRLALSQLLMRRIGSNVKFLLFDEVDQALDRHGVEALGDSINKLSNEFKMLVITHNDYMKEKIDQVLEVHMDQHGNSTLI